MAALIQTVVLLLLWMDATAKNLYTLILTCLPRKKLYIYILPFGKGKTGFGKTVVLLLQLVMNWNDNQINSQLCFSRTNPLAYNKVEEMWETEHLPSRNWQFVLQEKIGARFIEGCYK